MNTNTPTDSIATNTETNCFLCGEDGHILYKDISDNIFGCSGQWNMKECKNPACGLLWTDPIPQESELLKLYENYYTHQPAILKKKKDGNSILASFRSFLWKTTLISISRLKRKDMNLKITPPGKILVIGCGNGKDLTRLKSKGWSVMGQEIDPKAAEAARKNSGCKVFLGDLHSIGFDNGIFDAILLNHVLEHVYFPVLLLNECYRILSPQAKIIIVTPNARSLGHKYFRECWRGLDPPRHLHIFSPVSIKSLINKTPFSICNIITSSANATSISWASFDIKTSGQFLFERPLLRSWIKSVLFKLISTIYFIFNRSSGEECILIAKK